MIEPTLKYISEPSLTFGNGQTAIDPRDGLMLLGPFDQKNVDLSIARPNFPGLESTFGISISFDNVIQLDVKQKDIDRYLKYTDSHQRVHNLVNLYVLPLIKYTEHEEMPVDIWFIVISEDIYKFISKPSHNLQNNENVWI